MSFEGSFSSAYRLLYELVSLPLLYGSQLRMLHIEPPRGILIYGPPGVGKSLLVKQVADATHSHLMVVSGIDISSVYVGEGERELTRILNEATNLSKERSCILFLEDLDILCPKRDVQVQAYVTRRVAQLLSWMDGIQTRERVIVVGATQRPNTIDPALRRPGRFDREVAVDLPSFEERERFLASWSTLYDTSVNWKEFAEETHGYTLADLQACIRESLLMANKRRDSSSSDGQLEIGWNEIRMALARIGPSFRRDISIKVTPTSWEDIGGLESVKQILREILEWPLMYQEQFSRLGLTMPRGVLLYGPPGCSKTTLVKAIATNSRANFLSLHGAAIYSSYVGEAEQTVREIFRKARMSSPSVVFFDEIDAIVGRRAIGESSSGATSSSTVHERILASLLNEMDGIEVAEGVLVVGATNRPDLLDTALIRPGRFDRVVYVGPPDEMARLAIFRIHTRYIPLNEEVDLEKLAREVNRNGWVFFSRVLDSCWIHT